MVLVCRFCHSLSPERVSHRSSLPWEDKTAPARYVYRLGVAVEFGGQGLGKQSLEKIGELAKSQGAKYLRLFVAHENQPAIGLYRKMGFSQLPGEFGEFFLNGARLFEYAFEKRL